MRLGEALENYIQKKLAELEQKKDLQEIINKGKFSFGVDSTTYRHLPAWENLIKQKKQLVKLIWIDAFLVSITIIFITDDYFSKFSQDWLKALLSLSLLTSGIMLFHVITAFHTLFFKFRQTEREVRKLIYQDILFQLQKEREIV